MKSEVSDLRFSTPYVPGETLDNVPKQERLYSNLFAGHAGQQPYMVAMTKRGDGTVGYLGIDR